MALFFGSLPDKTTGLAPTVILPDNCREDNCTSSAPRAPFVPGTTVSTLSPHEARLRLREIRTTTVPFCLFWRDTERLITCPQSRGN